MKNATRLAIVSPHLDDAVFSLGAAVAWWSEAEHEVTIVTIFGGSDRQGDAGAWDRRCGFTTREEATQARRAEDRRATECLGAVPIWLPFDDAQYGPPPRAQEVWARLRGIVDAADVTLIPGFPVRHPDHRFVHELFRGTASSVRIGLYLEQPYAFKAGVTTIPRDAIAGAWEAVAAPQWAHDAKREACGMYASQIRPLSRRFPFVVRRMLRYERAAGGERVAWPIASGDPTPPGASAPDPQPDRRSTAVI